MKKLILALVFLLASPMAFATQAKAHIKGMVCAFCAQGITKSLNAKSEVSAVDVDLDSKVVTIDFKEGKDIPDIELEKILRNAGYPSDKIERE